MEMVVEWLVSQCERTKTLFSWVPLIGLPLPGESSTLSKCNAFMLYLYMIPASSFRATNVLMSKISHSPECLLCGSELNSHCFVPSYNCVQRYYTPSQKLSLTTENSSE
mgnify:CR=1 FL=1